MPVLGRLLGGVVNVAAAHGPVFRTCGSSDLFDKYRGVKREIHSTGEKGKHLFCYMVSSNHKIFCSFCLMF